MVDPILICRFRTWKCVCVCALNTYQRSFLGVQIRCLDSEKTWGAEGASYHPMASVGGVVLNCVVMLLRTQLPFGHWLFIVGYNVTFDRPPRRQRMPTCADNGHRAFKSADPLLAAHSTSLYPFQDEFLFWLVTFFFKKKRFLLAALSAAYNHHVAFRRGIDLMASVDGALMRPLLL